MPSPLTSGAALIHLATMVEHPDFGWAHFETLAKNGVQPQGGNGAQGNTQVPAFRVYQDFTVVGF